MLQGHGLEGGEELASYQVVKVMMACFCMYIKLHAPVPRSALALPECSACSVRAAAAHHGGRSVLLWLGELLRKAPPPLPSTLAELAALLQTSISLWTAAALGWCLQMKGKVAIPHHQVHECQTTCRSIKQVAPLALTMGPRMKCCDVAVPLQTAA
jgi:hypothetical protein